MLAHILCIIYIVDGESNNFIKLFIYLINEGYMVFEILAEKCNIKALSAHSLNNFLLLIWKGITTKMILKLRREKNTHSFEEFHFEVFNIVSYYFSIGKCLIKIIKFILFEEPFGDDLFVLSDK